ncbi:MAG TPA: GNAT family N-acetyltransferase [Bryobacteraceae bacterium]|nr:GNAT family N-acetyltransferase [Bryobacteraceae bacterium]
MAQIPLIRPATPADLPAVAAIYGHHVLHGTASFETEAPDLDEISRRHAEVVQRGLPYRVAEIDGLVVGFAYAGAYRPRPAYRFTVEDSVYIDSGHLARGIGRLLLGELICAAAAAGSRQMIAIIGDSGNAASIRLHESAGFAHVGVLRNVGLKFGRWLDTVIMQKDLAQNFA